MGLQTFYDEGSQPLLWARSRAARGKITVSGISNRPIYCDNLSCIQNFTNMAAGRIIKHGGPRIGDIGLDIGFLEF